MKFEYDPAKSASNLSKHGIDFDRAQALWDDPWLLEVPAKTEDEPRVLTIGKIEAKHWAAVWTPRGEDVSDMIDWSQARRRNDQPRRVNVDFPAWVVDRLDKQARHLGVTRQSLIKLWIAERLE